MPALGLGDTGRSSAALSITDDLLRRGEPPSRPSRPGEFHPEPLTDPDLTLSRHPARATARRLPPSIEYRVPPVAGLGSVLPVRIAFLAGLLLRKLRLFLITCVHHRIGKLPFRVLIDADVWKYAGITIIIGYLDIIYAFGNIADSESSVLGNGLILQFIVAPVLRFCRRNV